MKKFPWRSGRKVFPGAFCFVFEKMFFKVSSDKIFHRFTYHRLRKLTQDLYILFGCRQEKLRLWPEF